MAFLDNPINVNDLPQDERGDFEPIPAGDYTATITGAELKNTKAGTGQYINLKLRIDGPTHAGRVIFSMVNIRNANPEAERIGRTQLGNIQRAIGLSVLQDTDQLMGHQIGVKVAIKAATEQYPAGNEVKAYKAINGAAAPQPSFAMATASPAMAPSGAAPAKAAPPWLRSN